MLRGAIEAVALVALIAGALAIAPIERAGAQYPEPIGDVIIAVGDATGPGEDVVVTATVLDENGAAVAGASCTFAIGGQPGTDASVQPGPFTTDAEGRVSTTLSTGSGEGEVVVEATCVQPDCPVDAEDGCDLSATATVSVGGQAAPPGSQAEPPASLPDTGGGPDGAGGASGWAFFALGAGAVLTAFAAYRLRGRPGR